MAEQLTTTPTEAKSDAAEGRRRLFPIAGVIVAVLVILVIIIGGLLLAVNHPTGTARVRDAAIIAVAFMSVVIALFLVALLYQLTMLILLLRGEIKPLLVSLNETANTVRGTSEFMSENIVQPTIQVASVFSGVRRTIEVLAGIRSSIRPKQ